MDGSNGLSRRDLLRKTGAVAAGILLTANSIKLGIEIATKVVEWDYRSFVLPRERVAWFMELFGFAYIDPRQARAQIVPGDVHPLETGIHPDDKYTKDWMTGLFLPMHTNERYIPVNANDHLLLLGGPQSNQHSLRHLQFERKPDSSIQRSNNKLYGLHFEWEHPPLMKLQKLPSLKRYVGGRVSVRPPYQFRVNTPFKTSMYDFKVGSYMSHWNNELWLDQDWLIVTKVPNLDEPGKFVIVFGGLHGTGTKAAAKYLLSEVDAETMEEIGRQTQGQQYFQSLFHIKSVKHDHELRESTPQDIEHIITLPLHVNLSDIQRRKAGMITS